MPDPAADYLRGLNASDRVRAAAWDAVYAPDDATATTLLQQLPFSDQVRADLWDLRNGGTIEGTVQAFKPASAEQFMPPSATPQGSAAGRFISNAADMLNPVSMVQGLYGAVRHPVDTYHGLVDASAQQFEQAGQAIDQGRYTEAFGHGMAGALPVIGPAAAASGEQIASGDIAGGLGKAAGMLAPVAASGAVRGRLAVQARRGVPAVLERQAVDQVAQRVLAPGSAAFKGKAQAIAPEVLRRGMKGGRAELADAAEEGQATSATAIDDAINAGGGGASGVYVDPVIRQLQQRIDSLTVNGRPIPGAEGRIDGLRARIDYLEQTARQRQGLVKHGQPFTNPKALSFDDLRKIRDEQYRIANEARAYQRAGNPQLNDEGFAAAETGSAIRGEFARLSPELAQANADYTFFKTLGDILDPAQGRPKVSAPSQGVTGGAAVSGAVAGAVVGPKASFVLGVVRPWIQRMRSEPAWQLADAQTKMRLAEAIRNGDVPAAQKLMVRIGEVGVVGAATSPSESRSRTTAPTP